ncbi:MAG: HDIG domain-containing protein [Clostridiaceae bacterium]|nr:HDIG domain-containing protein [Clostridiaceae bacterium]
MNEIHKIFNEFEEHLLKDDKPSQYFNDKLASGIFFKIYPFTLLGNLIKTEQEPKHHPEGNVWIHTLMVVDECAKVRSRSEDARVFMWAALLHDLGKAPTTAVRKGKITAYDHDKVGKGLSIKFLEAWTDDAKFIEKVSKLVRWHMQTLFVVKDLPFAEIKDMLAEVAIDEIALLSICDRLGRGELSDKKMQEEKTNIEIFIKKCKAFSLK